jgi:hypothetical protein
MDCRDKPGNDGGEESPSLTAVPFVESAMPSWLARAERNKTLTWRVHTLAQTIHQGGLPMWLRALAIVVAAAIPVALAHAQITPQQYHKTVGPCACPNDKAKNGSRCGKRSAYCDPKGERPRCYTSDKTAEDTNRRVAQACG